MTQSPFKCYVICRQQRPFILAFCFACPFDDFILVLRWKEEEEGFGFQFRMPNLTSNKAFQDKLCHQLADNS